MDKNIPNKSGKDKFCINTNDFEKFLKLQHLTDKTIEDHLRVIKVFIDSGLSIEDFLLEIKETRSVSSYRNYLGTLKICYRDFLKKGELISGYRLPNRGFKPKILLNKTELRRFYESLPHDKYRATFILLASSGLRVSELYSAQIDKKNQMIIPQQHQGRTKNSWLSFYNSEAEDIIDKFVPINKDTLSHIFAETSNKVGIKLKAHDLRSVFAREMSKAGVQDRYIDAFCGRVPQSVLARHYSDYSPEVLKEIYRKANIKIME